MPSVATFKVDPNKRFPKIRGTPSHHPFSFDFPVSTYINQPFWDTPMTQEPHEPPLNGLTKSQAPIPVPCCGEVGSAPLPRTMLPARRLLPEPSPTTMGREGRGMGLCPLLIILLAWGCLGSSRCYGYMGYMMLYVRIRIKLLSRMGGFEILERKTHQCLGPPR